MNFVHSQSVKTGFSPLPVAWDPLVICWNWNCYQKQKLIIGCFDAPLDRDWSKSNRKGIVCSKKTWHQKEPGVSTGRACFVPSLRRCHALIDFVMTCTATRTHQLSIRMRVAASSDNVMTWLCSSSPHSYARLCYLPSSMPCVQLYHYHISVEAPDSIE